MEGNIGNGNITVPIRRLTNHRDLPLPRYMTSGAAGMDLYAAVEEVTIVNPGDRALIATGIALAVPEGYEAEIRPRSGLAWKEGVTILNSPGTIDADYRGEVAIIIINHGKKPFAVKRGDRIAQMIIRPVCRVSWQERESLEKTIRNSGGFGHTD